MLRILTKDHARSRCDRSIETGRLGHSELARSRGVTVAVGIGEMDDRTLQDSFDLCPAEGDLLKGLLLASLCEVTVTDGMSADRDQRIGGERFQIRPRIDTAPR